MTEPKPLYAIDLLGDADKFLHCPCCMEIIGPKRQVRGKTVVMMGKFPAYAIHGYCPTCGALIHWTDNDDRLSRILARAGSR